MGAQVFSDPAKRRLINKLTHPRVFRKIISSVIKLKILQRKPLVVLDAPLLFETKILEYFCYPIITGKAIDKKMTASISFSNFFNLNVVYCEDGQTQLTRLMKRNSLSEHEAMAKINS